MWLCGLRTKVFLHWHISVLFLCRNVTDFRAETSRSHWNIFFNWWWDFPLFFVWYAGNGEAWLTVITITKERSRSTCFHRHSLFKESILFLAFLVTQSHAARIHNRWLRARRNVCALSVTSREGRDLLGERSKTGIDWQVRSGRLWGSCSGLLLTHGNVLGKISWVYWFFFIWFFWCVEYPCLLKTVTN